QSPTDAQSAWQTPLQAQNFQFYSSPNLPPPNIKSVERPLDRWNGKLPIVSNRHAHTAPLEPGTSGNRLQRIGKQQREQILMLGVFAFRKNRRRVSSCSSIPRGKTA